MIGESHDNGTNNVHICRMHVKKSQKEEMSHARNSLSCNICEKPKMLLMVAFPAFLYVMTYASVAGEMFDCFWEK